MGSHTSDLDPVQLRYWPTCENALTWSSDDLAVAAGEVVHIVTPRELSQEQVIAGHPQWHTHTLRVNMFEQTDWPFQTLAPLRDLSLGEEQSDSTTVAIAWSPPGLGMYRRSVLAVLTSNLVLSLWETNGRLGVWKRTCVLNHKLPAVAEPQVSANSRRKQRIRAFCWLPALPLSGASRWTPQLLAVADDDKNILVFVIRKQSSAAFGGWHVELMGEHQLQTDSLGQGTTGLRNFLSVSSPVSHLEPSNWIAFGTQDGACSNDALAIKVSLSPFTPPRHISVHVERITGGTTDDPNSKSLRQLSIADYESSSEFLWVEPAPESSFIPMIDKLRKEYDERFDLGGNVRVRHWGAVMSPDRTRAAAAVSFHPSDVIEYGMPSSQRIVVVFSQLQKPPVSASSPSTLSPAAAIEEILNFIITTPADWERTEMDSNIVRCAAALISSNLKDRPSMMEWATAALTRLSQSRQGSQEFEALQQRDPIGTAANADAERGAVFKHDGLTDPILTEEQCDICGASIPFSPPSDAAKCANNHQFSRCSLSFVAVQEPGICRYCAKCGRQFLDPGKLEFLDGPSLSQALFDKFDVCPYCQGKFRG